jgi:hypothetical protein
LIEAIECSILLEWAYSDAVLPTPAAGSVLTHPANSDPFFAGKIPETNKETNFGGTTGEGGEFVAQKPEFVEIRSKSTAEWNSFPRIDQIDEFQGARADH